MPVDRALQSAMMPAETRLKNARHDLRRLIEQLEAGAYKRAREIAIELKPMYEGPP